MNFKTFLNNRLNEKKSDLTVQDIEKNCSRAWKMFENRPLLRGVMFPEAEIFKKVPRKDRQSKDSDKYWHDAMNKAFKQAFGKPLRSCSIFCSGNEEMVEAYGTVCKIFPSDDFEFYWSPYISDLTANCEEAIKKASNPVKLLFYMRNNHNMAMTYFKDFELLKDKKLQQFIDTEFPGLIDINNCQIIFNRVYAKYPNILGEFFKEIYQKGNYEQALKSGNEIMVTCSYYYGEMVEF